MEYSKAVETMLTGTYNAMREQLVMIQHENRLLKQALLKFCDEKKMTLEDVIKEIGENRC